MKTEQEIKTQLKTLKELRKELKTEKLDSLIPQITIKIQAIEWVLDK